jgi:murein L,D-transpeptidase YafK
MLLHGKQAGMRLSGLALLCLALFLPAGAGTDREQRPDLLNYHQPLSRLLQTPRGSRPVVSLRVEKSRYRLLVCLNRKAVKAYPVVFGGNPRDDKRCEGDLCTPEGVFRIRDRYPHRAWTKFLWLDYPNAASWRKFSRAKRRGEIPQSATIGSEIGIHGVPAGQDSLIEGRVNWTLGCIALKTADITELYAEVRGGTRVEIVP